MHQLRYLLLEWAVRGKRVPHEVRVVPQLPERFVLLNNRCVEILEGVRRVLRAHVGMAVAEHLGLVGGYVPTVTQATIIRNAPNVVVLVLMQRRKHAFVAKYCV